MSATRLTPPHRPPTIKDVASLAGVSHATVSRVINRSGPVAAETRRRVERAVARLDFVTSASARTLRPGVRSMTWGLLVDDVASLHFGELAGALDLAAQAQGCTLLVATTQKQWQRERRLVREMESRRVDGLFVVPANGDLLGERARMLGPATVYLDRIPSGNPDADVVTFDHYRAVADQVEALWQRGHRRIGFVGGEFGTDPGSRRYAAWQDTVRRHGIEPDPDLVSVGHTSAAGASGAAHRILGADDPPTALVTTTDLLLRGVLEAVARRGADVDLAGSEDFGGAFLSPVPLSVVRTDVTRLAAEAVELLRARIAGGDHGGATRILPVGHLEHGPAPASRSGR